MRGASWKLMRLVTAVAIAVISAGAFAADSEGAAVNLLFIHHSCGGALLAAPGPLAGGGRDAGERCLYDSHPNGGGLRDLLAAAGYRVHQASYGSLIGEDTDLCHWRRKFATQMDRVLRTQRQDALLPDSQTNRIVCFKSCYPNNGFTSAGREPGDPDDCERTVANAKAAYQSLLPLLRAQPEVLFVAITAPPLAPYKPMGLKETIQSWFRRADQSGKLAREFNTWLADRERGWLAGYDQPNVVVFDFYDLLTKAGTSDYLVYLTKHERDSHPNREGNAEAAAAFVPFLARAVAEMGWPQP